MIASLVRFLISSASLACRKLLANLLTQSRFVIPLLVITVASITLTCFGVSVEYPIPANQIKKERDHEYSFRLRWYGWPLRVAADAKNVIGYSTLYEDDRALGPAHSTITAIVAHGAGHYSLWRHRLYFSASDNTDPRANGRSYLLVTRAYLPPVFTSSMLTLLAVVILIHALRTQAEDRVRLKPQNRAIRIATVLFVGSIDIALVLTLFFPSNATLEITPNLVKHQFGHAYGVDQRTDLPAIYRFMAEPVGFLRLEHMVFEDGRRLGPTSISPQSIRDTGRGRNRFIDGRLIFSSTDNSDPRTNGREYRVEVRGRLTLLAVFLLGSNLLVLFIYQHALWKVLTRTGSALHRLPTGLSVLLFPAITCLISHALLSPSFVTNDDVANRAYLSGSFFLFEQEASRYAFLAPLLAQALIPLMDVSGQLGVDFFSLFLLLGVFVAHVLLMLLVREARMSDALRLVLGVVIGALFLPFYTNLQFTISSALLVVCSFMYLTRRQEHVADFAPIRTSFALISMVLGSLIRPSVSVFYSLLSAMWVAYELLFLNRDEWRKRVAYLGVGLVVASATQLGGKALMTNAEHWQYNRVRAHLTEFKPRNVTVDAELLRRAGVDWSLNDYALLKKWFFVDRDIYQTENLEKLLSEIQDTSDARKQVALAVEVLTVLIERPTVRLGLVCLFLATLIGLSWRTTAAAVLLPAILLCAFVALGIATKPPPHRVTLPVLAALSAAMLVFTCRAPFVAQEKPEKPGVLRLRTALFFGLLLSSVFFAHASCVALGATWRFESRNDEQIEAQRKLLGNPKLVWIVTELALPFEKLWKPWERDWSKGDFRFVWLGAHQHAVEIQRFLEREGDGDIVTYMCTRDNVLLVATPALIELLRTLITERYQKRFSITRQSDPNAGLDIWRCHHP